MKQPTVFGATAFDQGGKNVLAPIIDELERDDYNVVTHFPKEPGAAEHGIETLQHVNALLIGGPSSGHPEEEMLVAKWLHEHCHTPVFSVSDNHDTECRTQSCVKEFAPQVNTVFVAHESCQATAQEYGYRNVVTAIPPHWHALYQDLIAGESKQKKITVVGGKSLQHVANDVTQRLISWLRTSGLTNYTVCISAHPGERPLTSNDQQEFDDAVQARARLIEANPVITLDKKPGTQIGHIAESELVIFSGCGSTAVPVGALARIPGMYINTEAVQKEVTRQTGIPTLRTITEGGMHEVTDLNDLREVLDSFLLKSRLGARRLREVQEAKFTVPSNFDQSAVLIEQYILRRLGLPLRASADANL